MIQIHSGEYVVCALSPSARVGIDIMDEEAKTN